MPPRTRATKGTKSLKENLVVVNKAKSKSIGKINKPPRKALADKTNSASDDNTSSELKKNQYPTQKNDVNNAVSTGGENIPRPRRDRRLPTRFVGNNVLINLSNSKECTEDGNGDPAVIKHPSPVKSISPVKNITQSPFKTPQKSLETSLVVNRPKRICRLPSKFDDHSISPSKFIPVKPCHASTPILENKGSKLTEKVEKVKDKKKESITQVIPKKKVPLKRPIESSSETSSDTNNNPKRRLLRHKTADKEKISSTAKVKTAIRQPKAVSNKNFSFRVLEDKKSSKNDDSNPDVYEFTYDPNEEPAPAKKKRKKVVRKKPAQPKTVVFKNNYDTNVGKALEALKNVVKKPNVPTVVISQAKDDISTKTASNDKVAKPNVVVNPNVVVKPNGVVKSNVVVKQNNTEVLKDSVPVVKITEPALNTVNVTNHIEVQNYNSVRVEDIAADFELSAEDYNDINYSPVNSPQRPKTPVIGTNETVERSVHNKDPLNLRGDLSFFDDNPVASSSMNMSARHPQASPWRIEFGNLPIRWQVNSYVKPNMTPAVESSFINSEDSKKRHVYTNMIGQDESSPEIAQNQSNLKQTSIMSFIREVVERSAQKKKRIGTPTKANNNLFDDLTKGASNDKSPKKSGKADKNGTKVDENVSNSSVESENDKENSNEIKENKKKKTKTAAKDKDGTFFGFDESEDQENASPVKVDNPKLRSLRPRSRAVLHEINAMTGPTRALPVAAKSKIATSSDAVNKVYEELKSAADAPVFPEKDSLQKTSEVTAVNDGTCDEEDDGYSVHLFEDIELVHHLKPTRKSYGKAKKVTFRQHSTSSHTQEQAQVSSEEDDLADLTFTMPSFQPQKKVQKKKTKKQKMSKKEQKALEEWAAGFNSMCEDIEDVPLNVE